MKKYPIHFAPLQGHTDRFYRNLHQQIFGGIEAYYTPFIRVEKGDTFRPKDIKDCDPEFNEVTRLIPQALGGDANEVRLILNMLIEKGYTEANINIGCPFPMIVKRGKGAGVLPYPEKVKEILDVLDEFPNMRISVKMRLGMNNPKECLELIPLLNRSVATTVIMHARIGTQEYSGELDLETFNEFYNQCEKPIIYNGDLFTIGDINNITEKFPKLSGVMIGRGLLAHLNLALEYISEKEINREELIQKYKSFHNELFAEYSERLQGEHQILMKMRTIWEYLLPESDKKHLKKIKKTSKITNYQEAVNSIFLELQE